MLDTHVPESASAPNLADRIQTGVPLASPRLRVVVVTNVPRPACLALEVTHPGEPDAAHNTSLVERWIPSACDTSFLS